RDIQVGPNEILRTTTVGSGEPLVLIPGVFGGAYAYRMLTGPLAERGYRTIVVQPLGYGWSSHPNGADYSFPAPTAPARRALHRPDGAGEPCARQPRRHGRPGGGPEQRRLDRVPPRPRAPRPRARPPLYRWRPVRERGHTRHEEGVQARRAGQACDGRADAPA